jgi:hypothetical protein
VHIRVRAHLYLVKSTWAWPKLPWGAKSKSRRSMAWCA